MVTLVDVRMFRSLPTLLWSPPSDLLSRPLALLDPLLNPLILLEVPWVVLVVLLRPPLALAAPLDRTLAEPVVRLAVPLQLLTVEDRLLMELVVVLASPVARVVAWEIPSNVLLVVALAPLNVLRVCLLSRATLPNPEETLLTVPNMIPSAVTLASSLFHRDESYGTLLVWVCVPSSSGGDAKESSLLVYLAESSWLEVALSLKNTGLACSVVCVVN